MMIEKEFYLQAILEIFSSLDMKTSMERCKNFLNKYIPITCMSFGMYDSTMQIVKMIMNVSPPPGFEAPKEPVHMPKAVANWVKARMDVESKCVIIGEDDTIAEKFLSQFFPKDTSHMFMTLSLDEKRTAMLYLSAEGKKRYRKNHIEILSSLQKLFTMAIANILQHQEIIRLKNMLHDDNIFLQQQIMQMSGDSIIGANSGLRNVIDVLEQLSKVDTPVLLLGETGVGKELIANIIHSSSKRKNGPYIKVNCGSISDSLIDSELFGHEKGAFTGAVSQRRGRFERAHRGTIFLDEIGELPLSAQVRLLRVLQQKEIERVGGNEIISVDVRIVSATHRNLEELVRLWKFREDLYFRLNVFPVVIPPLRQRVEDIPLLVNHFIETKSSKLKIGTIPPVSQEALDQLQSYHWPGNVRELENTVERALIQSHLMGPNTFLKLNEMHMPFQKNALRSDHEEPISSLDEAMASHILKALKETDGKVGGPTGAARLLGLNPNTLRSRMRKLGIHYESPEKSGTS